MTANDDLTLGPLHSPMRHQLDALVCELAMPVRDGEPLAILPVLYARIPQSTVVPARPPDPAPGAR